MRIVRHGPARSCMLMEHHVAKKAKKAAAKKAPAKKAKRK